MRRYTDFDLTGYNSYRVRARCGTAYFPESEEDIIDFFTEHGEQYILLGSGHNVILAKDYYETPFLIFNSTYDQFEICSDSGVLSAQSGCFMSTLSESVASTGWSGLEIFYDIPSSLGGAIVMNAGASGEEIEQLLLIVRYLDRTDMKVREVSRSDLDFTYRNGTFQRETHKIVLSADLQLRARDVEMVNEKMQRIKQQRWAKQPREYPNAGSVFKRPPGYYVGKLVEDLNLKGLTVGGAKISEKHGGFIVNYTGKATGMDILKLIERVQDRVHTSFGVNLEVEQRVI